MVKRTFTLLLFLLASLEAKEAKKKTKVGLDKVLVYGVIGGSCLLGGLKLLNKVPTSRNHKPKIKKIKPRKTTPIPPPYSKKRKSVDLNDAGSMHTGMYTNSMGVGVPVGTTFGAKRLMEISLRKTDDDDDYNEDEISGWSTIHSDVVDGLTSSISDLKKELNKPFGVALRASNNYESGKDQEKEIDNIEKRLKSLQERVASLNSKEPQTITTPNASPIIGGGDGRQWEEYEPNQYQKVGSIMDRVVDLEASKAKQKRIGRNDEDPHEKEVNNMYSRFGGIKNNEVQKRRRAKRPHFKVYRLTNNSSVVCPDISGNEKEDEDTQSDTASVSGISSSSVAPSSSASRTNSY